MTNGEMNKHLPPRARGRVCVCGYLCRQIKRFRGRWCSQLNISCCRTQEGPGKRWPRYLSQIRLMMAHLNIYSCILGRWNDLLSLGRGPSAQHQDASKVAVNAEGGGGERSRAQISHGRKKVCQMHRVGRVENALSMLSILISSSIDKSCQDTYAWMLEEERKNSWF